MKSVAIIGSFQKYYKGVLELISLFKKNGFQVTSPYQSRITEARWGFVLFEADDNSLTDDEIQTDTLRKILNADAVYVYNPKQNPDDKGGYVGKTTCYEIGILMAKNKPLYYLEYPDDLPVPVTNSQIISPQDFVDRFKSIDTHFILPFKDRAECNLAQRNVFGISSLIICGSMKFYDVMKSVKQELAEIGIAAVIPENETDLPQNITEEEFNKFKRKVSQSYLKKIRIAGTFAILVINERKNDIDNYIGANTLVEIAMAFTWGRKIFIYNDVYHPYADELVAWKCVPIKKNLRVIHTYFNENGIQERFKNATPRLPFDDLDNFESLS
jgi:nucleoside 2-deoxyribosyltransferase